MIRTAVICFCLLYIQNIATQCIGVYNTNGQAWEAEPGPSCYGQSGLLSNPGASDWPALSVGNLAASRGGGFLVTSSSPIAPTGVALTSENAYEGILAVNGALPFLAAVSLEGGVPSGGAGSVAYSCGNGNVAILSEELGYSDAASSALAGVSGLQGAVGYEASAVGLGRRHGCGCTAY